MNSCLNCHKVYFVEKSDVGILNIWLDGNPSAEYMYCSKKCAEETLSNINSKQSLLESKLVIDETEVLSDSYPFRMTVYLHTVEPQIKLSYLGLKNV